MTGALWIFGVLIAIIIGLVLLGYIFYRFSRKKDGDMGFQDFLIDSIAHNKSNPKESVRKEAEAVVKAVELKPNDGNNSIINPVPPPPPPVEVNPFPVYSGTPVEAPTPSLFSFGGEGNLTPNQTDPLAEIHKDDPLALDEITPPESEPKEDILAGVMDIPNDPLKERPPEATLVEVIPAPPPPPPPIPEEVHAIPDWLKPLPKSTQHSEKPVEPVKPIEPPKETIVTTDISSVIIDPNAKKEDEGVKILESEVTSTELPLPEIDMLPVVEPLGELKIDEPKAPVHEEEEIVPDWLKPVAEETPLVEEMENLLGDTGTDDMNDDYVPPVIEIPPASTELPDWLKASVNSDSSGTSESRNPKPKKKKGIKKDASSTIDLGTSGTKSPQNEDIPDWLK